MRKIYPLKQGQKLPPNGDNVHDVNDGTLLVRYSLTNRQPV